MIGFLDFSGTKLLCHMFVGLAREAGDDDTRGVTIDTMGESRMSKSARWFPSLMYEIVLDLFYQGDFISFVIWAMDDES
jgi:hypothetical protein